MGRRKSKNSSNDRKGRLVEQFAAWLHESDGVDVQLRARLPSRTNPRKKREIDILLTGNIAGHQVRMAIECKNESDATGAGKIDAFVGKLEDVGIARELGIYVSASGYTSGAIERAVGAKIKPLILRGLTPDRMSAAVQDALQSVIFLLADVTCINLGQERDSYKPLWFCDENGKTCGSVLDLVWQRWLDGEPPSSLGQYTFEVAVPESWKSMAGTEGQPQSITATVDVISYVVSVTGQAQQHTLLNASDKSVDRMRMHANFDTSRKSFPIRGFTSEQGLNQFLQSRTATVQATAGRIRLPRIRYGSLYWPPSERVVQILAKSDRSLAAEDVIKSLDSSNVATVWEPIWSEHPAIKDRKHWYRSLHKL